MGIRMAWSVVEIFLFFLSDYASSDVCMLLKWIWHEKNQTLSVELVELFQSIWPLNFLIGTWSGWRARSLLLEIGELSRLLLASYAQTRPIEKTRDSTINRSIDLSRSLNEFEASLTEIGLNANTNARLDSMWGNTIESLAFLLHLFSLIHSPIIQSINRSIIHAFIHSFN